MKPFLPKMYVVLSTFLLSLTCLAQTSKKNSVEILYRQLENDEKLVAACERKWQEYQLAQFGKVLPKISDHCWSSCPTLIVLPDYPGDAGRLKIKGQVKIETIVDESGKVVYAKIIQGKPLISQAALKAAYFSTYSPQITCDNKPIKFRWTIIYNFY